MTINEKQQEIIDEFSGLDDWMDRYAYIIDLGGQLAPIDEKDKTPEHLIEGCQSRVWVTARLDDEGRMRLTADSDASIVKGIIAMLIDVLDGHTPQEILDSDLHFIDAIGLSEHLSPTRSNGLLAMIKQIKLYALAFNEMQKKAQACHPPCRPVYEVLDVQGSAHAPVVTVRVTVRGLGSAVATAVSKSAAEVAAAADFLEKLKS